jgi:hypothetical protein
MTALAGVTLANMPPAAIVAASMAPIPICDAFIVVFPSRFSANLSATLRPGLRARL